MTADNIHITLEKLPVTALLRFVGPPDRLDLIPFKWKCDFILVLNHKPGKRHSQVIFQSFFGNLLRQWARVLRVDLFRPDPGQVIPRIQNLEQ